MYVLLMILILGLIGGVTAAGAGDFRVAQPGYQYQFPRDHAAHPEFKTEWWYYTGHLKTREGRSFSYQITFFRVGLRQPDPQARSAWTAHTAYLAHAALTDIEGKKFLFREKASRGALGTAGANPESYRVWIDDWEAAGDEKQHRLRAVDAEFELELTVTPQKPPVIHGTDGISRKADGEGYASHYYSLTRLATSGRLKYQGQDLEVRGGSWMDHEFSSSQLAPDQTGWDWFSLQLDDGTEIMIYLLRRQDGSLDPNSSGTLVDAAGRAQHLSKGDVTVQTMGTWRSPKSGARYPAGWTISLPKGGYTLELRPTVADQELRTGLSTRVTYWEGSVTARGTHRGRPLTGRGYVELTGYAGSLGGRF